MNSFIVDINNFSDEKGNFTNNTNELANDLSELSKENPLMSTIENQEISSIKNSTYKNCIKGIRENLFPYPNIDEIPEIKIKDQDHFQSNEEIQFYKNFDDSKFNKCKSCGKNDNKIFCEN